MLFLAVAAFGVLILSRYARCRQSFCANGRPAQSCFAETGSADDQLEKQLAEAQAARDSGQPAATQAANERATAAALRAASRTANDSAGLSSGRGALYGFLHFEDVPAGHLDLGTAEIQAGQYEDAIRQAKQALAANPGDLRATRVLASALIQHGDRGSGGTLHADCNAEPTVENLYPLAMYLLRRRSQKTSTGTSGLEQMKRTAGDSGSLHMYFSARIAGRGAYAGGDQGVQASGCDRSKTPHAHYFLGLAQPFLKDWKPTPEAEAELRKEVEAYPHDYLANYMLGFLTSGERRYDESNVYLMAASQINPTAPSRSCTWD